jgi:multidrug transporter EmrE-like cation transporter
VSKLIIGILLSALASIIAFFQFQGQFKIEWMKNNPLIVSFLGVPIAYIFLLSVKYMVTYYDGQLWPSRLIGFGIGMVVFIIMSKAWFNEDLSVKTLVCLILSLMIISIQIFWK